MDPAVLMTQLVQLERAASACDRPTVRKLILEMEDTLLHLQQDMIETLRENADLRQRLEGTAGAMSARPIAALWGDNS